MRYTIHDRHRKRRGHDDVFDHTLRLPAGSDSLGRRNDHAAAYLQDSNEVNDKMGRMLVTCILPERIQSGPSARRNIFLDVTVYRGTEPCVREVLRFLI